MKMRRIFLRALAADSRGGRPGGFTLIEVVLALAVISVGLMGVLSLYPVGIKAGRDVVLETHVSAVERMVTSFVRADWRGTGVANYNEHDWLDFNVPQIAPDGTFMPVKDGGLDWDKDGSPDFHVQYRVERGEDPAELIPGLARIFIRIGYPVQTDSVDRDFDYNEIRYLTIELANDIL